jgi:hypothetical protein
MNRFLCRGAAALLVWTILAPGSAHSQQKQADPAPIILVGPVIVHPALTLKETYTDNVFYRSSNAKSDFITAIGPELTLKLPYRMHELSAGASAEFLKYANHSSLDASPYQVFGLAEFNIGRRFNLKVGDTYQRNEETPLESPNGTSDTYTANRAAFSARYAFIDVAQAQLEYARLSLDFLDSSYRTRDEDLVSAYLYYRVLPNTSAFLEYEFKNVTYDNTDRNDNVMHSGLLGATWGFSERSKGTVKIGYLGKNAANAAREDFSTWTASVDVQRAFTDAATVRLLAKRDVNEGKQRGVQFYTTTGAYADFTYRFLKRLSGTIEGAYSVDEFSDAADGDPKTREDKTAHLGVSAAYSFNAWLDFVLAYGHSERDSNISLYDATINTVTLKVKAYR